MDIGMKHLDEDILEAEWPTPEEIREARLRAGLSQADAAALAGLGAQQRWAEYEAGQHQMDASRWLLFLLLLGLHPTHHITRRRTPLS
jgi:hypothetical protein